VLHLLIHDETDSLREMWGRFEDSISQKVASPRVGRKAARSERHREPRDSGPPPATDSTYVFI
jgi:hypothetical protein